MKKIFGLTLVASIFAFGACTKQAEEAPAEEAAAVESAPMTEEGAAPEAAPAEVTDESATAE